MSETKFEATRLILRGFELSDEHTAEAGHPVTNGLEDWIDSLIDELRSSCGRSEHLVYWYKELYGVPYSPTRRTCSCSWHTL